MRTTTVFALFAAAAALRWQDPRPQDPRPQEAAPTPAAAPATDVPGRPERHPLEGVYELKKRVVGGRTDPQPNRGYLAITSGHLFLCLASPGARPDRPLVHAGVREWHEAQNALRTTVKIDYWSDGGGAIHLEQAGKVEARRIEPMRGGVRVLQGDRSWLEFERVE